jgi:hypothetical protein
MNRVLASGIFRLQSPEDFLSFLAGRRLIWMALDRLATEPSAIGSIVENKREVEPLPLGVANLDSDHANWGWLTGLH